MSGYAYAAGNTRQRGKGSRFLDDTPPFRYASIYRLATCVRVEREWDQDPQADTRVEKGTVVRVQVGRERIPSARARALARPMPMPLERGHLDVKDSIDQRYV